MYITTSLFKNFTVAVLSTPTFYTFLYNYRYTSYEATCSCYITRSSLSTLHMPGIHCQNRNRMLVDIQATPGQFSSNLCLAKVWVKDVFVDSASTR